MGIQFHFDVDMAKCYGVNEAIFTNSIYFWCRKNEANGKNFRDGHYWTYSSTKALQALFPFWSRDQINRIIKRCQEKGLILVEKDNPDVMDQTRNFAISDSAKCFYENCEELSRFCDDVRENAKCYKDKKRKTDIKNNKGLAFADLDRKTRDELVAFIEGDDTLAAAFEGFFQMRKRKHKPLNTQRALTMLLNRLREHSGGDHAIMTRMLDTSTANSWSGVYPPDDRMRNMLVSQKAIVIESEACDTW